MNKVIVVTTIRPPTKDMEAWMKVADEQEWQLVVVGDMKTNHKAWQYRENVHYLTPDRQVKATKELAESIPWNHYARKNLGYVYAIKELNADVIFETDDDNAPISDAFEQVSIHAKSPEICGHFVVRGDLDVGFFNAFEVLIEPLDDEGPIWPRGYPMTKLRDDAYEVQGSGNVTPRNSMMRQFMCNGEPDRCAIQRLTYGMIDVEFDIESYVLDKKVWCPFNTQSTLTFKGAFDLMYVPWTPPGRCTDIVRGWIAQRLLWERDSHLSFHEPVVYQTRNEHNLQADLYEEVPLYRHTEKCLSKLLNGQVDTLEDAYDRVLGPWVNSDEFATIKLWKDAIK